jgi:hypothetical protein
MIFVNSESSSSSESNKDPFSNYRTENYVNAPKKTYKYEPIFNYRQFDFLTEETVPDFAKAVFIDRFIKNTLKQKFLDEFLVPYMTDNNFRRRNSGKYIVFLNKKRYLIIDNLDNIENVGDPDDGKLCIYIGNLPNVGNVFATKIIIPQTEGVSEVKKVDGGTLLIHKQHHTHLRDMTPDYIAYDPNIKCIFDPGADVSSFFLEEFCLTAT